MSESIKPEATSPLAAWLDYIEHLHTSVMDLGLERVRMAAERLHLLHPKAVVFTVAGTNGKGTTCTMLESVLVQAGYRVGVYSSPHLFRYTERVRIQGQELAEQEHSQAFDQIEQGREDISLTYFEYSLLSALLLFRQKSVEVIILEVGLGGRLDATNIIDTDVAVITTIALDHTHWLGTDREAIGREKAGILRSDKPAVFGELSMPESIAQVADEKGARLYRRGIEWDWQQQDGEWSLQVAGRKLTHLPPVHIPVDNAASAVAALNYSPLQVSEQAIREGMVKARLAGRFQIVQQSPLVIVDVAHNPHAAAYLAQQLQRLTPRGGKLRAVVGMLSDKDVTGVVEQLQPLVEQWYCASLKGAVGGAGAPGLMADELASYLPGALQFDTVPLAWQQVIQDAQPEDTIVVFGSFHTVSALLALLTT